jgi:hypothetical protein
VLCLQETKRSTFELSYLKIFSPTQLDSFIFTPYIGASGGILTVWNGNLYTGGTFRINAYANTIKLTSNLDNSSFHLSNIYGPSASAAKLPFITL